MTHGAPKPRVRAAAPATSPTDKDSATMSTDAEWEKWGRQDPYFGVITNPRFRARQLDEASRQEFFDSGKWHAQYVFDACRRYSDPAFAPARVLDFGCGVGRLLVPFAEQADAVLGLDVSASMLAEAERNCQRYGVHNVTLIQSDDSLSAVHGLFDLVHSAIVFQHIEPERGRKLFARLLQCLAPGGVGAVQVTYAKAAHADTWGAPPQPLTPATRSLAPRVAGAGQDPEMQMNSYNLNHLLFALQNAGIGRLHAEFTDHGGELGVFMFFQKPQA